ncbi:MAG TPA: maleylpyruvate isomerase family mycothiol-dependent enzyme [Acidimicrobiales bacterium]|nr:maleylpyruvate isomerase family mycothiol-dependent enzyme [Acidimicrobiales bacterium]
MTKTTMDVTGVGSLTHEEAMRLQAHELDRTLALLRSLDDAAWNAQTDCPAWDVKAMYKHVLGACEAGASMRENVHQLRRARSYRKQHGGPLEAALSTLQVSERADLAPAQIVERLTAITPKTVRGRTRTPALVRNHAKMAIDGPVIETWTLGYLIDTIYLRDLWMHRVDVAHALNRPVELTPEHDGRIVADIVAEWGRRHGKAFVLDLTGPAGGTFAHHQDLPEAEHISMDAVEFCRTLAGRQQASGLLATVVPF